MNEYMAKNNMQAVEPTIPTESAALPEPTKSKKADVDAESGDKEAVKPKKAAHGEDADSSPAKEH
jgi:hypothetical protein